ncbi:hypothetical protein ACQ4XT_17945 [Halobacillus faecis]
MLAFFYESRQPSRRNEEDPGQDFPGYSDEMVLKIFILLLIYYNEHNLAINFL